MIGIATGAGIAGMGLAPSSAPSPNATGMNTGSVGGDICCFHRNSSLVSTRWRRATADSDAPGISISAMLRRLSPTLKSRRPFGIVRVDGM